MGGELVANISRYNAPDDALDDLFRGFFLRPVRLEGHQDVQIKLDVSEVMTRLIRSTPRFPA